MLLDKQDKGMQKLLPKKGDDGMNDFASIYQEFQPKIFRYLCRLVGEADAPDLEQAVFLKISQTLEGFRGESSLATWIYRIATNTAHDYRRSSPVKHRELEMILDDPGPVDDLLDSVLSETDQEYIRREMNDCILSLVDQLPENYRTIMYLGELEGFTGPEIAEITGLSLDTVKIRLHRARNSLRKAMNRECNFYRNNCNELMCDRKSQK